uniref:Uncharacterized protein n=1 Tax=Rhizophora mucronata TaxID=61149 RepID=A0A2P2QPT2_RHIMU
MEPQSSQITRKRKGFTWVSAILGGEFRDLDSISSWRRRVVVGWIDIRKRWTENGGHERRRGK